MILKEYSKKINVKQGQQNKSTCAYFTKDLYLRQLEN
jgi:hypothetical protein